MSMSPCRLLHKPHIAGETVTIFYRFHPLGGKRAVKLGHRSHRGEPMLMVADEDGCRFVIPCWMTDPDAAEWTVRDVPRLSRAALSELQGLVALVLHTPDVPDTGECNETSKREHLAAKVASDTCVADHLAARHEGDGRPVAVRADRGSDATRPGPNVSGRRQS